MTPKRPELAAMPSTVSGYWGVHRFLMIHGAPSLVWRVYWLLQPLRCLVGFHNWYHTAAGLCSACTCGASAAYTRSLMHQYRWRPWLRPWARAVEDAEYRAEYWQSEWMSARYPKENVA